MSPVVQYRQDKRVYGHECTLHLWWNDCVPGVVDLDWLLFQCRVSCLCIEEYIQTREKNFQTPVTPFKKRTLIYFTHISRHHVPAIAVRAIRITMKKYMVSTHCHPLYTTVSESEQ